MLQVLLVDTSEAFEFYVLLEKKTKISDHVVITTVNPVHSNLCDPSYVGQFLLSRIRSGDYKRCDDEVLREIMVQMTIDPFVNDRVMIDLLQKILFGRKDVDRYMKKMLDSVHAGKIRIGFKKYSN